MPNQKFTISLNVENIGPHYDGNKLSFTHEVDSNKSVFFAVNGTGKSFLSKTFRLAENLETHTDDLLTIGRNRADFTFSINANNVEKHLSVVLEKYKEPVITNTTGLLFHTFNSDFVEENIKPRNYNPNGDIDGYILGKAQIDLTDEKLREANLVVELNVLNNEIESIISKAKSVLRNAGVTSNTTEMALITRKELEQLKSFDGILTFKEVLTQLEKLRKVPENLSDISIPKFDLDISFLDNIADELITSYPKSEWDEEFVRYYKENRPFIEAGLDKINSDVNCCPFCQRTFDEQALQLIQQYSNYRNNQEAKTIALLDTYAKKVKSLIDLLKDGNAQIVAAQNQLNKLKEYFPSLKDYTLSLIDLNEESIKLFTDIHKLLEIKTNNLVLTFDESYNLIKWLKLFLDTARKNYTLNASILEAANRSKNNTACERLELRRKLCKAKYIECSLELKDKFAKMSSLQSQLESLRLRIKEKEEQVKVSKRDKVYSTLTSFLNVFFNGKYTIDKETFEINFWGNKVGQRASRILSDGEKSIVAYCYYLATTHLLIERESDYDKLFFIIDDPISSMDFHYVYMVAQTLRDIKNLFDISTHERIWVFTHNMEFLSIIKRNHILKYAFIIKPGKIEEINHNLLMPYESHLTDIVKISKGEILPNHNTANSIRHVLETVCQFEFPEKGIEKYIEENEILAKNAYIYSICQDLSHGNLRNQPPYSADVLISACASVVEFMTSKYKGQIDAIK
ncbi:MAG: AAA family ATPase [Clostridiales bacterium]|nr:AAA family ATPase [Clostridiales bacterium]